MKCKTVKFGKFVLERIIESINIYIYISLYTISLHDEVDVVVRVLTTMFRSTVFDNDNRFARICLEVCTRQECSGGRIDEIKRPAARKGRWKESCRYG